MFAHLKEDIQTILRKDPAALSTWHVLTCYPGFHALSLHRIAYTLWINRFKWLASWIAHWARWLTGIEIHPAAKIGRRVFIDHGMGIVIGETAEVGDDCTIYQGVTLGGTSLTRGEKRHPTLEAGVIIGAGAKVLGSFTVGAGAKVGSNAVVVKPVPAGATAVGNPAHIVGEPVGRDAVTKEFSAYGLVVGEADPIMQALNNLLGHLERSCKEQDALRERLKAAGVDCGQLTDTQSVEDIEKIRQLLNR